MATTTRAVLRQRLSEALDDYQSLTTSAAGAADGSTLVDVSLRTLPGGRDDDSFEGWYVLLTSGSASGDIVRVLQSRQNNNTLTFQTPASAQVANSVTFELHRWDPVVLNNSINRALEELSRQMPLMLRDETLVVDNLLSNSDFETLSTTFTGWTNTGTPTLAQNTSLVMHGDSSASITATGATEGITQSVTANTNELTDKQVQFECWVYATAADSVRTRILWGSSSYESHDYHSGTDQWELQSISASVPTTATEVTAVLEVVSGATGIFDASWMAMSPVYKYTIPTSFVRGPHYVTQQADRYHPQGTFHPIPQEGTPTSGRILRLEGLGILSRPSSDTATTEIGEPYVSIVTAYAGMYLNRTMMVSSSQQQRQRYDDDMKMWGEEAESLLRELHRPKLGAKRSTDTWHIEEDASGRYIVFDRLRV